MHGRLEQRSDGSGTRRLLVCVHGFRSDEHTWDPLLELLAGDEQLRGSADVVRFGYRTGLVTVAEAAHQVGNLLLPRLGQAFGAVAELLGHRDYPSIRELGEQLACSLAFADEYDEALLVAHSMGGLVGQQALVHLHRLHGHLGPFQRLLLYATPQFGAPVARARRALERFGLEVVNAQLRQLRPESNFIHDNWNECVERRIAARTTLLIGGADSVAPLAEDDRPRFERAGGTVAVLEGLGHEDIHTPRDPRSPSYRWLARSLAELDRASDQVLDPDAMLREALERQGRRTDALDNRIEAFMEEWRAQRSSDRAVVDGLSERVAALEAEVRQRSSGRGVLEALARALGAELDPEVPGAEEAARTAFVDAFERLCAERRLTIAGQVDALEQAAAFSSAEAAEIGRAATAALDLPEAVAGQVHRRLGTAPGRASRTIRATLELARGHGTAPTTALPLDENIHGAEARRTFLRGLLPETPRFEPGAPVPHRGGWWFREHIASGGFGEVWLIENPDMGELEVIKLCLASVAETALLREVDNLGVIRRELGDHPNIVGIRGLNRSQSPCWIALEYVAGGTLTDLIRSAGGPMPAAEAVDCWRAVCRGVAAAHRLGIVHRDLKPANILLAVDGTPRVADFGIGKLVKADDTQVSTVTMAGYGTAKYASPEQRAGQSADPADDVYALGVILFQMLVGDPNAEPPRRIERALASLADPSLIELIDRCLDTREERPRDAEELLEATSAAPDLRAAGTPHRARGPAQPATSPDQPATADRPEVYPGIAGVHLSPGASSIAVFAGDQPHVLGAQVTRHDPTSALEELARIGSKHLARRIARMVVTVPALATIPDRLAVVEAARSAGLEVPRTLSAIVAVAVAHRRATRRSGRILALELHDDGVDLALLDTDAGELFEVVAVERASTVQSVSPTCAALLRQCGFRPEDVGEVILVGEGQGKLQVRAVVREALGREPTRIQNAEQLAAHGAALLGAVLEGGITDLLLLDVLPLSLGVATRDGRYTRVVDRWCALPFQKTERITAPVDARGDVHLTILQGESQTPAENVGVQRTRLANISPDSQGRQEIEVTLAMDATGKLELRGATAPRN